MATIVFSLSKRVDDLDNAEILIRFCASRENIYRAKSGIFVPTNRWSKKNTITIPKIETPERKKLIETEKKLNELKTFILERFEVSDKKTISKNWLVKTIDEFHNPIIEEVETTNFFKTFDRYIEKKQFSQGRQRAVDVVYRMLKRYELHLQKSNKHFSLTFEYFTSDTLFEFEKYLRNEQEYLKGDKDIIKNIAKSRIPKLRGSNTISTKLRMLRSFFIWCKSEGIIETSPFEKYKVISEVYGTPYYITIEERNKIYNHDFSKHKELRIQRDIFIFQCHIGCRVGDLMKLKKQNVINGAIEYIASKTKEGNPITVRVPLNATALEIINRYAEHIGDSLLPFSSEIEYNLAIKKVFTMAKITRHVTRINPLTREPEQVPINTIASSHLARRTFIGNLYKQVKDPNLVGSMSGHKEGSKAFARYRDIDDEIKTDLVNLLL
jgi:integrase